VLDEALRIKNWATAGVLTVKQLDPPYRLVLTGTHLDGPSFSSMRRGIA
jgi:hypothetical protein